MKLWDDMRERTGTPATRMPAEHLPNDASYEQIGLGYARARRTEPRIAERIFDALADARTVLNVGAGTGSYEPADRDVLAVEPSRVMRSQRPPGAAPCIDARAEALPFADQSFDAALAVLSDHHWPDPIAGLREMRRVARRVVVFQWDDAESERFWLVRDYLPEFHSLTAGRPSLRERAAAIDARTQSVPIPCDVIDGFFHAYWRRPAAYLREPVRRGCSVWARVGERAERRAVTALGEDLDSGAWAARNAELLDLQSIDLGARLLIAEDSIKRI
jgi:SAM-dependent methyltransferase